MSRNNVVRPFEGGLRTLGQFKRSEINKPLLTIVMAVFNGAEFIEETILSVIQQSYKNIEFIIIDGNSTDGTQDVLRKYEYAIDYWVSASDNGISDAFNKGLLLSSGDYINFQGAGDYLVNNHVVFQMLEDINPKLDMLICGRVQRVSETKDKVVRAIIPKKFKPIFNKKSLLLRMSLPHQALFTHKKMFEEFGLFDVDNVFCMDYEHLLRAYKKFPNVVLKNVIFSSWREGGIGTGRLLEIFKEYNQIKIHNKVAPIFILKVINLYILTKYIFKKILFVRA